MTGEQKTRECPYCKEEILSDAIKCKHCLSMLTPEIPKHDGICPYCKEDIKQDAIKCKHCKSDLTLGEDVPHSYSPPFKGGSPCDKAQISNVMGKSSALQSMNRPAWMEYPGGSSIFFPFPFPWSGCYQICLEYSKLFPNICNRWIWVCF